MKLLLTSAGISNVTIRNALVDLLGKPIADANALVIPTAAYAYPEGPTMAYRLVTGIARTPLAGLGWKSLGILELTALPSINKDDWVSRVRETDALLVGGGGPTYLAYWMRKSGLAELLPTLTDTVWVGVSGGSLVLGSTMGDYDDPKPPAPTELLGLVDFAMYTHLDHPDMPDTAMANVERWAAGLSVPAYGMDDQTALRVVDGKVDVISEGHWRRFTPSR